MIICCTLIFMSFLIESIHKTECLEICLKKKKSKKFIVGIYVSLKLETLSLTKSTNI